MTDIDKDSIREWYKANGLEYLPEDWGARAENGESASPQTADPDRIGREWVRTYDPHKLVRLESLEEDGVIVGLLFPTRSLEDAERNEALEAFFASYLVRMTDKRNELLEDAILYGEDSTQAQLAAERGVSQQAVSKQLRAAQAWLVREVAKDWPDPEGTTEQRFEAVLNAYWQERFGVPRTA